MRKKWMIFWTVISCAAALLLVLQPVLRVVETHRQRNARLAALETRMAQLEEGERALHRKLAKWYNYNLRLETPEENFRDAYGSIFSFGEGMMGVLRIPVLQWQRPIYHGPGEGEVLHHPDSPFPTGGRQERIQLSIRDGEVLEQLRPGMAVQITCMDSILTYTVSEEASDAESILILTGQGTGGAQLSVPCVPGENSAFPQTYPERVWGALLAAGGMGVLPVCLCGVDRGLGNLRRKKKSNRGNMEKENNRRVSQKL